MEKNQRCRMTQIIYRFQNTINVSTTTMKPQMFHETVVNIAPCNGWTQSQLTRCYYLHLLQKDSLASAGRNWSLIMYNGGFVYVYLIFQISSM